MKRVGLAVLRLPLAVHLFLSAVLTLSGLVLVGIYSVWFAFLWVPGVGHAVMAAYEERHREQK